MRLVLVITIVAVTLTVACSGSPIQPPPPPPSPEQLQVSCPLPIVREATTPLGTDVHFDAPAPTGGRGPYNVECLPGSSSVFPIGETNVKCTAIDADRAQASCGFAVTVRVSKTLSRTRFLAFGDSITAGAISLQPLRMLSLVETYPFKLEQMLLMRYPSQTFVVSNQGVGAERTDQGARRLPGVLDAEKPEVVMILEGTNAAWLLTTSEQANNIRTMITSARNRGIDVIIATVMPIRPEQFPTRPDYAARIIALNERIVQMAAEFKIGPVVDLYALFQANMNWLGPDGLHPTPEGQTHIAEAFSEEIVRRYDVRSSLDFRSESTALRSPALRRIR